jgi:membrane-associated phospholipid phosphatase
MLSHLAAGALAASWAFEPMRGWWDALDEATFRLLNGSLDDAAPWQFFWALTNHRAMDLFTGGVAAIMLICWVWGEPRAVQNRRAATLCALAVPVIALLLLWGTVNEATVGYRRDSPSIVIEGAIRLTQLVPSFVTKDASRSSFPGDHAIVLFSIVLFYAYYGARKFAVASAVLAVLFLLPRLFAGAHWLTDNAIGGAVPALIASAWVMATPLGGYMARFFLPPLNVIVSLLPPWLRIPERRVSGRSVA